MTGPLAVHLEIVAACNLTCTHCREQPLEQIWHESQTFRAIRALPGGTNDTFSGGCRARALVLSGSANAPDPWLLSHSQNARRVSPITFYHPGSIVELTRSSVGDNP